MACVAAVVVRVLILSEAAVPDFAAQTLFNFVYYNVALMVFNLIPVPPLDGSTLLFRFLPLETSWRLRPLMAQYGFLAVFLVVILFGRQIASVILDVTRILVGI